MKTVIIGGNHEDRNHLSLYLNKQNMLISGSFEIPEEGLEFVTAHKPETVIVDLDGSGGVQLGDAVRATLPEAAIVYISQSADFAMEAYRTYPTDYILKPVEEKRLSRTLDYIRQRHGIESHYQQSRLRIHCFGNFCVCNENEDIRFPTKKVRELLAFLLCHYQRPFFKDDLIGVLFNTGVDRKDTNNFRVSMFRLRHVLYKLDVGQDQLLLKEDCTIEAADGICDLIDFIKFTACNKVIDEQNIDMAQKIIESFTGEPFSDMDTPWVTDAREIIIAKMQELSLKTAAYYLKNSLTYKKAEHILLTILEVNDMSEHGYAMLLDLYIRCGETDKFVMLYRRYAKILEIDLGEKPERRLTENYIKLTNTLDAI